MANYISREEVLIILSQKNAAWDAYHQVQNLPIVKLPERKTGKWTVIENDAYADGDINSVQYWCSACNDWNTYGESNYCPNCGARMVTNDV